MYDRLPEPHELYDRYADKQENELAKLPTCDHCNCKIQDDHLIDIEGFLYHETCFETLYRKNTDDYVV